MDKRNALNDMRVDDVWTLVEENPSVIGADEPLVNLLDKVARQGSRDTIYVVTKSRRLCGTVSVRSLLSQLFPLQAIGQDADGARPSRFGAVSVGEVMNLKPRFVTRNTRLSEMARIMMRDRVNELPVVDERLRLHGEVSIRELFSGYLRMRGGPPLPPLGSAQG